MDNSGQIWPPRSTVGSATPPPDLIQDPMEFLSRSWSPTSFQIAKAVSPRLPPRSATSAAELYSSAGKDNTFDAPLAAGNSFTFASSATSQLVLEKIMSHSQEASQPSSARLSHSSGPLNGGSLSDSPPFSPSDWEDVQDLPFLFPSFHPKNNRTTMPPKPTNMVDSRTLRKWLNDRKEQKKNTNAHNPQLQAAVSVASLAAAIAAATAAPNSTKDYYSAIASAATLVAAQCVETAESLGADRRRLAAAVSSAVSARSPGDIVALTNSAAAALRGAAAVRGRVFKEMWNIAAVIPVEKGFVGHSDDGDGECSSGEVMMEESFLGLSSQEFVARGAELLRRSRTGALHWNMVSVYLDKYDRVKLKIKSRHVVGTITNKKKSVIEVWKDMPAWPGRHLLEGGEERFYFGLKTMEGRVIEFECRGEREYEMWVKGVGRLLLIAGEKGRRVP